MRAVYKNMTGSGTSWIHWYSHDGRRHRKIAGTKAMRSNFMASARQKPCGSKITV